MNGLTPLLVGWNTNKNVLSTFFCLWNVANMSGVSSNSSKILEFVNFSLKFPRLSKKFFSCLKFPLPPHPKSRNHVAKPNQRSTPSPRASRLSEWRVRVCKLLILKPFDRALLVNFPEILVIELKKGFNRQFFKKLLRALAMLVFWLVNRKNRLYLIRKIFAANIVWP